MRTFYVYILANDSRQLYVGVTNDLVRRIWEHRFGSHSGFTRRYAISKLVYFEPVQSARDAIGREKYLKGRHRSAKVKLIQKHNNDWLDLAAYWFE